MGYDEVIMTRRRFIYQGSCSLCTMATMPRILLPVHVDLSKYSVSQYESDVYGMGLDVTWNRICESLIHLGEPKSGAFLLHEMPRLYLLGHQWLGRNIKSFALSCQLSNAVTAYAKRCEGNGICGFNCGIGVQLIDYLSTLGTEKVRKAISRGLLRLYDMDILAMRICASAITARFSVPNGGCGIKQIKIESGMSVSPPRGFRAFVCDSQDANVDMIRFLDRIDSAVILTSRSLEVETIQRYYPRELKNWNGSIMSFSNITTGQKLSLIVIESKNVNIERSVIV